MCGVQMPAAAYGWRARPLVSDQCPIRLQLPDGRSMLSVPTHRKQHQRYFGRKLCGSWMTERLIQASRKAACGLEGYLLRWIVRPQGIAAAINHWYCMTAHSFQASSAQLPASLQDLAPAFSHSFPTDFPPSTTKHSTNTPNHVSDLLLHARCPPCACGVGHARPQEGFPCGPRPGVWGELPLPHRLIRDPALGASSQQLASARRPPPPSPRPHRRAAIP